MTNLRLHIGCGDKQFPLPLIVADAWTNVDSRNLVGIEHITEMHRLPMFKTGSVDEIYACHVLEHVSLPLACATLEEWARVLRPQRGILRLAVPDVGFICKAIASGAHLGRFRGLIWGGQSYPENTHYTGWDYEELANDLRLYGFFNIQRYNAWEVMKPNVPPVFRDFSFMKIDGVSCSLNVEAIAK